MTDPLDKPTWVAIGFLGCGALLVVVAALQMNPMANNGTTLTWSSFVVGSVALAVSFVLFNVAVALREASWVDVGICVLIGVVLVGGSMLWLHPMAGEPVIFHPALAPRVLGTIWLFAAVVNALRAGNRF
ncbi:hypothetical protein [Corynebacterium occultum]|uniref:hypothetical protein n=1 Tax=Corynebacterium occultum TaxID=2675219 RepID=UPI0012E13211|nr:hypothetical protein [Corynebacterium occultum]